MSKPRHLHNMPDLSKGPGDGADEAKEEGEGTETGGEEGEGKRSAADRTTPSPTEQLADTGRAIQPKRGRR